MNAWKLPFIAWKVGNMPCLREDVSWCSEWEKDRSRNQEGMCRGQVSQKTCSLSLWKGSVCWAKLCRSDRSSHKAPRVLAQEGEMNSTSWWVCQSIPHTSHHWPNEYQTPSTSIQSSYWNLKQTRMPQNKVEWGGNGAPVLLSRLTHLIEESLRELLETLGTHKALLMVQLSVTVYYLLGGRKAPLAAFTGGVGQGIGHVAVIHKG